MSDELIVAPRDICLRGTDEADVLSTLRDAGLTVTVEGVEQPTHDPYLATVVMIGTMTRPTGVMIEIEGIPTEEREPVAGFHANVLPSPYLDVVRLDAIRAALARIMVDVPAERRQYVFQ